MKKFSRFYLIGIFLLGSCSKDFLNIPPETISTETTFFKTESQFDQALVGAYQPLRQLVYPGLYMDEMRADNAFFRYYIPDRGPANWVEDIIEWTDQSQTTVVNNRYYSDYSGISRTNTILGKIESSDLSDDIKKKISGEDLFLRAFYYFDLVTHYSGVPLYLNEVVDEKSAYKPRATEEEVYNQIISDLKTAIPNLPVPTTFPQSGRATRGAAKVLLAKAYMSKPTREYALAESELIDITKMNYGLLDNYADVFDPTHENSKESIFEIQYREGDDGQASNFIYSMMPKTANTAILTGISVSNTSLGGWGVPTQEFIDSYENGDLRLPASIKIIEGTLNGGSPYFDPVVCLAIKDVNNYTPETDKVYYPYIAKFIHGPYSRPQNTGENWPVFRYAGALLLLAEDLVQQGKANEALPYLNKVRSRAGLPALTEATLDNVLNERRHELAFENQRWTDLIRTGKAIEVMSAYGQRMKGMYNFLPANSFNVNESRLVYPIPFREIQVNPELIQNPGY